MPVASVCLYVKGLVDNLPMPAGLPPMRGYITPPDPNVEAQYPTAYVWPAGFTESRDPKLGGSIPRNTGPGTPSGQKPVVHGTDVFIVYFLSSDDPLADSLFPGIVDAVTAKLRTSQEGVPVTDPFTGTVSELYGTGEVMRGRITVRATSDQVMNRYDCLLTLTVRELIRA